MEKVPLYGSLDRSLSSSKSHVGNSRKIHQLPPFISKPYDAVLCSNLHSVGVLQTPPRFLFHSYPSYSLQNPPQPPLLPLPAAPPRRGLSCPQPLTRKKSKSPTKNVDKKSPKKTSESKELLKNVAIVSPPESKDNINGGGNKGINVINDMIPGSMAFTISPPPSSLPLPSFCLRPKLSCNAEAVGVDDGATDNLRRLLRLR